METSLQDKVRFERERKAQLVRSRRWARLHPAGVKAHGIVWRALKSGKIVRGTICQSCGESRGTMKAHHEDCSRPLDITWLCGPCHKRLHLTRAVSGYNNPMSITDFLTVITDNGLPVGSYCLTRYGKPWRVVVVSEVGAGLVPVAGPAPVDCVATQPASVLVGKVEPLPAPVVAGRPLKVNAVMARFLAAAEAEATSEPKAEPMTRARWKRMSMDARAHHIQHFTECATEEERLEWEETLPA